MAKKILAVDDDRQVLRVIQVSLERAGYTVITATDGREALMKIAGEQPDLVVLDAMMPVMNGMDVLHEMRANPATRDLPVIMLTSKTQDQSVFLHDAHRVDIYLTKPFTPAELVTLVNRLFTEDQSDENEDDVYTLE